MNSDFTKISKITENISPKEAKNQRLFLIEDIRNTGDNLNKTTHDIPSHSTRCEICGYPLTRGNYSKKGIPELSSGNKKESSLKCFICKRTKILNGILIASYVLSGLFFIATIFGVIFDIITLDISLILGCLEIIILLFFGRFLEDMIFVGLSNEEKALAALYSFSETGEMQTYDIAINYLKKSKIENISTDIYQAIFRILTIQSLSIPYYFYIKMSDLLELEPKLFIQNLMSEIELNIDPVYLESIINKAPPAGVSEYLRILNVTRNNFGLDFVINRINNEFKNTKISNDFLKDFYINKSIYFKALQNSQHQELLEKIDISLQNLSLPRVPSMDVMESGKKIINNPLVRYLFRIVFYIALAFILGMIYQLLNKF
ncbi:MAG: hypothetical protein ACFFDW_12985 [Candidatus Thorarchaeota archaeon]